MLKSTKALLFVSTCDEVEYFHYLFSTIKYRKSDGAETNTNILDHKVFKLHGNID